MSDTTEKRFLALICSAENKKAFATHLQAEGYEFHAYPSMDHFLNKPQSGFYYSGLVLDGQTSIKFTPKEKESYKKALEGRLPVLELTLKADLLDAVTLKLVQSKWFGFLKSCEVFDPRGMRSSPRLPWILRVEFCPTTTWDEKNVFRAVTGDISAGGCFVISSQEVPQGAEIWVRLLPMTTPILCRIAWQRPWGASRTKLPGLGLEFVNLSPELKADLDRMIMSQAT